MKALSDNKQTTINLITSLAAFVINAGISFVLTPYILEKLGNEAYGFIGLAYDFVNYAGILTLALNSMSCRFVSYEYHRGNKEKADIYVNSILGANLILAGAITLCALFMVWKLEYILTIPKALMFDVKLTFAIVFINYIFGICFSVFNSGTFVKNRMDLYYLRNLFSYVLKLVLTILIFTLFDVRIFFIALTTLICNAYMNVATYILMRKLLPDLKLNLRKFKWKTLSEVLRSGVWNSVQSLSDLMISGLNSLLTNRFIGTAAGGYLQSSKTIPNYILQLGQQLAQVFSPKFTILYAQGDYDRLVKEAKRSMRLVGFIISTPVAGFIVFGYQLYALWLKNYSPAESTGSNSSGSITLSAPSFNPNARRFASVSLKITRAPCRFAHSTCSSPITPPPITTTSSPILIWERLILLITHASGSVNAASSSGVSLGYTYRWRAFTTAYSEKP